MIFRREFLRWFWRVYITATLTLVALFAGPLLEQSMFPVRIEHAITNVVRGSDRLCWTWTSTKIREGASDNVDVFLYAGDGRRAILYLFAEGTGRPWGPSGALPIGERQAQRWCAPIPPHVAATETIRVEQIIYYPGFLRLWTTRARLPDLISPPA